MYNARNGADIAVFLADPTKEDIDEHLDNLRWVVVRVRSVQTPPPPPPLRCVHLSQAPHVSPLS